MPWAQGPATMPAHNTDRGQQGANTPHTSGTAARSSKKRRVAARFDEMTVCRRAATPPQQAGECATGVQSRPPRAAGEAPTFAAAEAPASCVNGI